MKLALLSVTALAAVALMGHQAMAVNTNTGTVNVSATVNASCAITTANLAFPTSTTGGSAATTTASQTVTCSGITSGSTVTVTTDGGLYSSQAATNGTGNRAMKGTLHAANYLNYAVSYGTTYTADIALTSDVGTPVTITSGTGSFSLAGQIASANLTSAIEDTYSDTLTLTVSY
jgi:hypothetical protein